MKETAYDFTYPIHKKKAGVAGLVNLVFDNFFSGLVFPVVTGDGNYVRTCRKITHINRA